MPNHHVNKETNEKRNKEKRSPYVNSFGVRLKRGTLLAHSIFPIYCQNFQHTHTHTQALAGSLRLSSQHKNVYIIYMYRKTCIHVPFSLTHKRYEFFKVKQNKGILNGNTSFLT